MNSIEPRNRNWLAEWGWDEHQILPSAAYVHIPFCRHRCGYCNFSLLANRADLYERFLSALEIELSELRTPRAVETIFLGGGTPSILPAAQLARLMKMLRTWLPLTSTGEWSMETNPLDVTHEFCQQIKSLGVNRLSVGGQSFQADKLKTLERDHTPSQLIESVKIARQYFESVSLDLIFAAPNETLEGWQSDLSTAIDLELQHISTYGLTFEKGARFWAMKQRNEISSVTEELELELYQAAIDSLTQKGYEHYEVSNFAKPGFACRHNQNYWQGKQWWAFGPSAARYIASNRSVNHRGTIEYIRRIEQNRSPIDEFEPLSNDQKTREQFVFGMRQLSGIDWQVLKKEADSSTIHAIEEAMERHVLAGWMIRDGQNVRLSREGLFISDSLWSEYL